jgi:hypothetical protein
MYADVVGFIRIHWQGKTSYTLLIRFLIIVNTYVFAT